MLRTRVGTGAVEPDRPGTGVAIVMVGRGRDGEHMREIGYHRAESVDHAVALAAEHGEDAEFLAGGQSLVPMMKARLLPADRQVIDLGNVPGLSAIEATDGTLRIGALATHAAIADSETVAARCPAMTDMVEQVGDVQVRAMGTIGGDLAQADPQADYPTLVTALGADLVLRGEDGRRTVEAADFFHGYFETALAPDELLETVSIPLPPASAAGFSKFAERSGDFPLVNAAVHLSASDGVLTDARVRVGGTRGRPVAIETAEDRLGGTDPAAVDPDAVGDVAAEAVDPDPDEQVSRAYKCDLAAATVADATTDALGRLA